MPLLIYFYCIVKYSDHLSAGEQKKWLKYIQPFPNYAGLCQTRPYPYLKAFCKKNVIMLGIFRLRLTIIYSIEVIIFFSIVVLGHFFLLLNFQKDLDIASDLFPPFTLFEQCPKFCWKPSLVGPIWFFCVWCIVQNFGVNSSSIIIINMYIYESVFG